MLHRHSIKKAAALLLACTVFVLSLAGCGSNDDASLTSTNGPVTGTGPDGRAYAAKQVYHTLYNSEVSTLNYLYSSSEIDLVFGANCVEPLVVSDEYGKLQPAAAESWSASDDGLTWTLKIREGMKWYDYTGAEMGEVTAEDWVTGLQWVLDARNDSSNTHLVLDFIVNSKEYYEYTAALVNGETPAVEVKFEDVGVKAVDKYTLEYKLVSPKVFFPTLLEFGCFYPIHAACVAENGSELGVDNTRMWYCGAYIMDTFEPQQLHVYVKNPNYWDADKVYIERIEEKYNAEASTLAPTMFLNGEIDATGVNPELLTEWMADEKTANMISPNRRKTNYTFYWGFNFEPMFDEQYEPDNWRIAVNNENFRKSIYHGLDRIRSLQVAYPNNAKDMVNNTITPNGFAAGETKDYTMYGNLAKYTTGDSFNEKLALEYKDAAVKEMKAAGATFPVKILVQYNGDTTWAKECLVIKQQLEDLLGKDYIELVINNFGSQNFLSGTRRCGNYAFQKLNGGAGFTDPETWLFMTKPGNNYTFAIDTTDRFEKTTKTPETVAIVDEYLALCEDAKKEVMEIDARYEAFANAEAFYLDHAMCIPYSVTGGGYSATKMNPFESPFTSCGWSYLRYKGSHLYETAMNSDMFYEQLAKWEQVRGN